MIFMKLLAMFNSCAMTLIALACVPIASAQYAPHDPNQTPGALTSHYVKTGLYVISGGGGNTVLRLSGNGLILVNGKFAGNFDELLLRVRKIVDQPIRVVINTDHFEEHTGTNARFLADGIRVVAQENVKQNMVVDSTSGASLTPPSATYDHDQTLRFGAVQVELLHFGRGRTNGDTVVYFPDLKTVAVGNLYSLDPEPDYAAGGSLIGWAQALGEILKLDFNLAVPDSGPAISRLEIESLKAKIDEFLSHAAKLVKDGTPKDQLVSQLQSENPGLKLSFRGKELDGFYAELSSDSRRSRSSLNGATH
jgi:glyoxylase-like metal-dependent hydrolase (beta-lactamase superfamily II)